MSILGNRVVRSEDARFITGAATYGDDLELPGALHATFVRSVAPHARIRSVDTSAVGSIPGAQAFTAADVDLEPMPVGSEALDQRMVRPLIAGEIVRHVGEVVGVVVTEDRLQGADAAELVDVELDELPAVADVEAALRGDTLLFPESGTN